jgi:DNA polymerase III delta prime subunit
MKDPHGIWVEKYRPDSLAGYIGNQHLKNKLQGYIVDQDIPHLLFVGKAGTGKTTAAQIIIKSIECDSLIINASDENNIDTVRTKIRGFASTMGWNNLKIVFLDEFDGFTRQGQDALRNLMEQFSKTTRFILTANYLERVSDPIISRTQQFIVTPPSKAEVAQHLAQLLTTEKVAFALPDLKLLIDSYFPDIRKIIGEAQNNSINGELQINQQAIISNDIKLQIIELLKASTTSATKLKDIRQFVANSKLRDFTDIYRILFDRVTDYAPTAISPVILALGEGVYRDVLVLDKEITFIATITLILEAMK